MGDGIDFKIEGMDVLIGKLGDLDKKVRKKAIKRAVRAAGAPILKAAKAKVSKRTGGLKKSLKSKIKTYGSSGTTVAIIGPDKDYLTVDEKGKKYRPAKIAHIVERGSSVAAAHPFILPAFNQEKENALNIIAAKLREDIENG